MTHRLFTSAFALGIGLALSHSAAAADIRIATEGAYPPWNTMDASGNLVGFELDLAKDLCTRMELECEVIATDWDGIIPGLLAGKYDAIMAGMSSTEERKKAINFSESYATTPVVIATREGTDLAGMQAGIEAINFDELSAEEQTAADQIKAALDGKSVAVQGATTHQNLVEAYFTSADVRTYDTMENAALDLSAERVDAFVTELPFLLDFTASDQGKGIVRVGPNMSGGPLGGGVAIGIRKDDTELTQKFNDAIEAAKADGTIEKLGQQWFGFDVTPVS